MREKAWSLICFFFFFNKFPWQVAQKTAATFAPRASTATKNPAVPGTALYTVFEVQGYASMLLGGALSFNLIFPSNEPDLWRLMGMWSIWMFSKLCPLLNFNLTLSWCVKYMNKMLNLYLIRTSIQTVWFLYNVCMLKIILIKIRFDEAAFRNYLLLLSKKSPNSILVIAL